MYSLSILSWLGILGFCIYYENKDFFNMIISGMEDGFIPKIPHHSQIVSKQKVIVSHILPC